MRRRYVTTCGGGRALPGALVAVFLVLAAVNGATAVLEDAVWPVAVAVCCIAMAIVVSRACPARWRNQLDRRG